jgi:hypothetical protein
MINEIVRGAYLLIVAAMIAAYALSPAKSDVTKPQSKPVTWVIFS